MYHQDKSVLRQYKLRSDEASTLTQNEAYGLVLQMQENKAYTTVTPASQQQHTIDIDQPHDYEEISLPIFTHLPEYAEIKTLQPSHISTHLPEYAEIKTLQPSHEVSS